MPRTKKETTNETPTDNVNPTPPTDVASALSQIAQSFGAVSAGLKAVTDGLKEVKEALNKPITSQTLPDEPRPTLGSSRTLDTNEQGKAPQPQAPSYPVPQGYRHAVDSILNAMFGLEVEGHTEAPVMTVTVVVPDKYSTASSAQKQVIGGRDIRPKVMSLNGGVPELEEWLKVVYSSFPAEIQSQIVADRRY